MESAAYFSQSAKKSISLNGIFPAITTPFNEKQDVFYEKLQENIQHYEKLPFSGYLLNGSNGEVSAVTIEERLEIVRQVKKWISPGRLLIANAYCESTKLCCELSKQLASNGADAVLVMCPFYHRRSLNEEAILVHFRVVADESPVPVIVNNNPGVTGIDISVEALVRLAEHPNIKGVKDGDVEKISEILVEVRAKGLDFDVCQSSVGSLVQSLAAGATAGIIALPNILGHEVCQVYQLYKEGATEKATNLQVKLSRINKLLSLSNLGVPGMKATLDLVGLYGGPCRLPLQPLPPQQLKRIRDQLVDDGLL